MNGVKKKLIPKLTTKANDVAMILIVNCRLFDIIFDLRGHKDRYAWTVTNVNILEIYHILYCLNMFHIHRHRGEARLPFHSNGMFRWSPFGRWSMERLWVVRGCEDRCLPHGQRREAASAGVEATPETGWHCLLRIGQREVAISLHLNMLISWDEHRHQWTDWHFLLPKEFRQGLSSQQRVCDLEQPVLSKNLDG